MARLNPIFEVFMQADARRCLVIDPFPPDHDELTESQRSSSFNTQKIIKVSIIALEGIATRKSNSGVGSCTPALKSWRMTSATAALGRLDRRRVAHARGIHSP